LWNTGRDDPSLRLVVDGEADLTRARLALSAATRQVIARGLLLVGVEPREVMR